MAQSERIHLAVTIGQLHANGSWRYPGSWQNTPYYGDAAMHRHVARVLERGCFDLAFFADTGGTQGDDDNIMDTITWGTAWPRHEPVPLAMAMAEATTRLGLGITYSTTYQHPFHTARLFNSLDHVTRGRIAWNAVTSAYTNEAANWGYEEMPSHEWRYQRAHEHIDVCHQLWRSVPHEALVMERDTKRLMDTTDVHRINHRGEHFSVRGPLPCIASPQGSPPVISAGASPDGLRFAATWSDYQFGTGGSIEAMRSYRERLDAALAAAGRTPRDVGVLWSFRVDIVSGPREARERERQYLDGLPPGHDLLLLSQLFSVDFTAFDPDARFADVAAEIREKNTNWGYLQDAVDQAGPDTTVGEYARYRLVKGHPHAVGTAVEVADALEEYHDATGRNGGFMFGSFWQAPLQLERVVDELVPELRRRGLARSQYKYEHLRDNLRD